MKLVFDIVKVGKHIPQKRKVHFDEEGGVIGRQEDCDWVLTDPNSYISSKHARILCKHGTFFIKDESTNGIFLKNPYKRLPKNNPVKVNASDVFIIGDHELQARFSNNDYSQDDIVSSLVGQASIESSIDEVVLDDLKIIPDDDFLAEPLSSLDEDSGIKVSDSGMDVMSMFEDSAEKLAETPEHIEETFFEDDLTKERDEIGDFIAFSSTDLEQVTQVETKNEPLEEHVSFPRFQAEKTAEKPIEKPKALKQDQEGLQASIAILEAKLGIEISSLEQVERDALMSELGDVLLNTLESLRGSLLMKDKIKQDLHLSTIYMDSDSNNPIKLGSATTKLLQNKTDMLGMMKVSDAITTSFDELDSHSIALHSSTKSVLNIAASKFSPKNLAYKFESSGALRGVLPKQQLMWIAYVDMFDGLNERPECGVEMMQDDFKKVYENIMYSLRLQSKSNNNDI